MIPLKPLFPAVILIFHTANSFSQNSIPEKWQSRIIYIKEKYPNLPTQKLDSITIDLDSTAIGTHCYQFITNPDKTKFIAFFLTDNNDSSFHSVKREYGGIYRTFTWAEKKGSQIEAFAYTVTGMLYKNKWYYSVGEYLEFYAASKQQAQDIFLTRTLAEENFFTGKQTRENRRFWDQNDFAGNTLVVHASMGKKGRADYNANKAVEQIACTASSTVWTHLHDLDSLKYHRRYKSLSTGDHCLCLYNSQRNIILLPIIYYDHLDSAHLSYYVLKLSPTDSYTYTWKKFTEKPIHRSKGNESLEVVYDIRTFIKNWGWGTTNMISEDKFWKDNF
jgi:hypothetical protein